MAINVLIVDDSSVMRKIVTRALRQALPDVGEVSEASGGLEALKLLHEGRRPHLILSDVNMPGLDGISFVKHARQLLSGKSTRIMMITTESSQDKIKEAMEAGADSYLTKPFTPDQMTERLEKLGLC